MKDNRTARERAEELAQERWPDLDGIKATDFNAMAFARDAFTVGFLAAKAEPATITAEQIEKAERVYDRAYQDGVINAPSNRTGVSRDAVKKIRGDAMAAAFRAVGFRIEGEALAAKPIEGDPE